VYGFKLLQYQIREVQSIKQPEKFLLNLHEVGFKFIFKPPWRLPIYRGRKRRAGNILPTNVLKSTQTR
jgi:hypothetical protein